jgi:hypothetical protein
MSYTERVIQAKQLVDSHLDHWFYVPNLPSELVGTITPVPANGFVQLRAIYTPTDHVIDTRDLLEHDHDGREAQYDHNKLIMDDIMDFLFEIDAGHTYTLEEVSMGLDNVMVRDYDLVLEHRNEFIPWELRPAEMAVTPGIPQVTYLPISDYFNVMTRTELKENWFKGNVRYLARLIRLGKSITEEVAITIPQLHPC